ncbi:hypothetical protein [Prescottella sp. R16]|uniref:hypothetical protein n=1 Tax=Prescottella sp. R16 TaxID=3064529 RepID=UPI00272E079A|nr:hypothetical protein [Prescottella sp. R16]
MAEFADNPDTTGDDTDETSAPRRSRWPSIGLLVAGLAALLVSGWALIGPFPLDPLGHVGFRWLFVAVAVLIGASLVFSPARRKR